MWSPLKNRAFLCMVLYEPLVVAGKPQEVFYFLCCRPQLYLVRLFRVRRCFLSRHNMTKKTYFGLQQVALVRLEFQSCILNTIKYLSRIGKVLFKSFTNNNYNININYVNNSATAVPSMPCLSVFRRWQVHCINQEASH